MSPDYPADVDESERLFTAEEDLELFDRAVGHWGAAAQVEQAIEELEELHDALNDRRRGRVGANAVRDEIADVLIMVNQLAYINDPDLVDERIEYKMNRLEDRLDQSMAERGVDR